MKKRIVLVAFMAMSVGACVFKTSTNADQKIQADHAKGKYQCPMDCEKGKMYDSAGKCPVCKMDLEKK